MCFVGKIWKNGTHWLISVPALDVATQGKSKRNALKMLKDAIQLLVNKKGFNLSYTKIDGATFLIKTNQEQELIALMLKRQRVRNHLTIQELTDRLNVKSKNAYAQYEQGKNLPSLKKIQDFLSAMNRKILLTLNVIDSSSYSR